MLLGSGGGVAALGALIVLLVGVSLYFVPTIVGVIRKVPNVGSVVVINLFLGWTLIGWVVALAMAARSVPPRQ
ncbi:MAG TPA: superinfection immunity protein [Gaiellaceae bacterium]|nr:superinfection immunity protein [Gaiellaceae bacterium]